MNSPQQTSLIDFALPIKPIKKAIPEAQQEVYDGIAGNTAVLKTRWSVVNKALNGGFRFGNNYLLAGMSGSGKSYMLNNLVYDFTDPQLNPDVNVMVLSFSFEMSSSDEILRMAAGDIGIEYNALLSAEQRLDPDTLAHFEALMNEYQSKNIFFVDGAGTREQIYATVQKFVTTACTYLQISPEELKLVITLDHTLLVESSNGDEGEIDTMAKLGKMFIKVRKEFNPITVFLGQLNSDIEKPDRRRPGAMFPLRGDIFGSKQILHAFDTVFVLHRPELLNLSSYGASPTTMRPTKDLAALHVLKARKGKMGVIWLTTRLDLGTFVEEDVKEYTLPEFIFSIT